MSALKHTCRWLLPGVLVATLASCAGESATPEFCAVVLDRIVEIELVEQGFRDAALAEIKKRDLHRVFAGDVQKCLGRPVAPGALACIRSAVSTEEISHRCLR